MSKLFRPVLIVIGILGWKGRAAHRVAATEGMITVATALRAVLSICRNLRTMATEN